MSLDIIRKVDPDLAEAMGLEHKRQQDTLELIASENLTTEAVMAAQGSVLTNKYAEGYPGARYYGGCEHVDVVENLAIERAKGLFKAEYANVQPHSGSGANMAVYFALLQPGDTVLGMDLAHGGHLTHGSKVSFSGRLYNFIHYGVGRDTGTIDYNALSDMAQKHKPRLIVAGASAYPRIFDFETMAGIARDVGAWFMVDMAHIAGLVAAGVHPSPVPWADVVTTTTHKTLRGPRGGLILGRADLGKKINSQIFPGIQGGPLMHVIAAKAVALKQAATDEFVAYQKQTVANAGAMAKRLKDNGLDLVSGGTDNHLMLVDLANAGVTGAEAEEGLEHAGITVNKNAVPFDPKPPKVTSGIRIGTPAVTSRGMAQVQMEEIADLMMEVLKNISDESVHAAVRDQVERLCRRFPVYQNM
ncbi:MAG: serine hydroxymethyltransferase [Desulfatibacillaceae bacterium]